MPNPRQDPAAPAPFDVAVVGAGASGAALMYVLSRYSNISRLALIEKYAGPGLVNSNARNNSQTLHVGDIETNYSIEKARQVRDAAMMVKRYTDALPERARGAVIRRVQKMVLGVGPREVSFLNGRYAALKELFPTLEMLDGKGIEKVEPEIMKGRGAAEVVAALFNPEGYAVNFGALAASFTEEVRRGGRGDIFFNTEVLEVKEGPDGYTLLTSHGALKARVVIFDTDAYSLSFAKKLGYGREYSLIPIAGSFYFTPKKLNGKVYRVQDPRMPFAAVHGDPELTREGATRWGPTARFYPVLEAGKFSTSLSFFASSGFGRWQTWASFISILLDPIRFWYLLKNFFYDLPFVGKYFLLPQLRLIVPSMRGSDLTWARGYGGMRLQRVDTRTRELLLGEGKIVGRNIVFNMSPSPGASVCLYNALRDANQIVQFLPEFTFDRKRMLDELCATRDLTAEDISLPESYAS